MECNMPAEMRSIKEMTSPSHMDCKHFIVYHLLLNTVDKDSILGEIAFKRSKSPTYVARIASVQYLNKDINMASVKEVIQEATPIESSLNVSV